MEQRGAALAAAAAEPDPGSPSAAQRLRRQFDPELSAWAVTQTLLRRKAARRHRRAAEMWFTPVGLEQSTRDPVAQWRARRYAKAGVSEVWDLGCGIGSDAMALAEAGMKVVALDADPATVEVAAHNLALVGGGSVHHGRAEDAEPPEGAALFLDPARRSARGRTWDLADLRPSWSFVLEQLAGARFTAVKLGPGVPKGILPAEVQACWVSHCGDVVEVSLWNRLGPGRCAVVIDAHGVHQLSSEAARPVESGGVGRYLIEPDGAVIRAGLLGAVAPEAALWLLDEHVAYLSADVAITSPYATCFEVLDSLPYDVKQLRSWVREHRVGILEIKKRAIDIDPAALRRQLKPQGTNAATLVIARTVAGTRVLVVRRLPGG